MVLCRPSQGAWAGVHLLSRYWLQHAGRAASWQKPHGVDVPRVPVELPSAEAAAQALSAQPGLHLSAAWQRRQRGTHAAEAKGEDLRKWQGQRRWQQRRQAAAESLTAARPQARLCVVAEMGSLMLSGVGLDEGDAGAAGHVGARRWRPGSLQPSAWWVRAAGGREAEHRITDAGCTGRATHMAAWCAGSWAGCWAQSCRRCPRHCLRALGREAPWPASSTPCTAPAGCWHLGCTLRAHRRRRW